MAWKRIIFLFFYNATGESRTKGRRDEMIITSGNRVTPLSKASSSSCLPSDAAVVELSVTLPHLVIKGSMPPYSVHTPYPSAIRP